MDDRFKQQIKSVVLTPMFSCGNKTDDQGNFFPEIRTSELKALMRFVYRITSTEEESHKLYRREGEIFGNAQNNASPIRLQIIANDYNVQEDFLRYYENSEIKKDVRNKSIPTGTELSIWLRQFRKFYQTDGESAVQEDCFVDSFDYKSMLELSLIVGGIGRRARRARGCIATAFAESLSNEEMRIWVVERLNQISGYSQNKKTISQKNDKKPMYQLQQNLILGPEVTKGLKRPVIRNIFFDDQLTSEDPEGIQNYLCAVDEAAHNIKKSERNRREVNIRNGIYATGHFPKIKKNGYKKETVRGLFASSVIVSLAKTKEGIVPVYTSLNACYNQNLIVGAQEEQEEFIQEIKKERRKLEI